MNKTTTRWAGALVLAESLLIFVPMIVLGAAIGWPASLDEPAATLLPKLVAQAGAVQAGYTVYFVYSLIFLPVVLVLLRWAGVAPGSATGVTAIALATTSVAFRCIGILRWLTVMPALAVAHAAAAPDERGVIEQVYFAINTYGGAMGELLGVSLFAAAALAVALGAAWRRGDFPRWLALFGFVAVASLLAAWLRVFGLEIPGLIVAATSVYHFFLMALGLRMIFGRMPAA
jgi:hypothetical protein